MAVTYVNKMLAVGQQTEKKEMANMIALICDTRYLTSHLSQPSENEGCTSQQTTSLVPYCAIRVQDYVKSREDSRRIKVLKSQSRLSEAWKNSGLLKLDSVYH